ncbi:hypothetical protein [Umezawaea endophytica]|uniref:Uncharacterized protein n=1 Tax=Umezawaea endophytica TaxID=1654476 RepID=A0A9X2VEY9_9PSEU|nr:hypothetical protein [Umezawaea endophytica]MCS7475450.1 hypothetical protein [Umezawaea endophytica]
MTDPRPLLPLALIAALLGVSALLALVAPSRVTGGVYQVDVGGDVIATESLSCHRVGDTAACVVPVGGRELAITVVYPHPNPVQPGTCTAVHGDRRVACTAHVLGYGHASQSVWIDEDLGLTEDERARLRDAVPWWRSAEWLPVAIPAVLVVGMAGAAFVLGGRVRQAARWRLPVAIGTGLLGVVPIGTGFLLGWPSLVALAVLAAWQWQSGGTSGGGRGARWGHALSAGAATAVYSVVTLFVLLLDGGFID